MCASPRLVSGYHGIIAQTYTSETIKCVVRSASVCTMLSQTFLVFFSLNDTLICLLSIQMHVSLYARRARSRIPVTTSFLYLDRQSEVFLHRENSEIHLDEYPFYFRTFYCEIKSSRVFAEFRFPCSMQFILARRGCIFLMINRFTTGLVYI